MESFTVDRATWMNGRYDSPSQLLTTQGMRCCLGFALQQCGIPDNKLLDVGRPSVVFEGNHFKRQDRFGLFDRKPTRGDSDLSVRAMQLNDAKSLFDQEREQKLIELFANKGIEIKFIGDYPDVEEINRKSATEQM